MKTDTAYDNQEWWTSPLESEDGQLIMVTGRADIDAFRSNPRYSIRIEVTIPYQTDSTGMPGPEDSQLLGDIVEAFERQLVKDPVAVLTGIYTGAGERNMVFYATSTHIFNKKLNAALEPFPLLPLRITAENDPQWEEYAEMRSLSEIH